MLLVHTVFIALFHISLTHQVCVISFGKMSSFLSYSLLCTLEYYNHLRLLKLPWCLYFSLELMLPIYICGFWVFPASSVYLSNSLLNFRLLLSNHIIKSTNNYIKLHLFNTLYIAKLISYLHLSVPTTLEQGWKSIIISSLQRKRWMT